jgi:hypothetical protein
MNILDSKRSQIKKILNHRVVYLVENYNFGIKFVFIGHHMTKYIIARSFPEPTVIVCRLKPKTGSDDPISLPVQAKNRSDRNQQWWPKYHCRLVLSLLVQATNRQWCAGSPYHRRFVKASSVVVLIAKKSIDMEGATSMKGRGWWQRSKESVRIVTWLG